MSHYDTLTAKIREVKESRSRSAREELRALRAERREGPGMEE